MSLSQTRSTDFDLYSALQFILSLAAALGAFALAGLLLLVGMFDLAGAAGGDQTMSEFVLAGTLFFAGLLLCPSAVYALLRLAGRRPTKPWLPPAAWRVGNLLLLIALPLALWLGDWAIRSTALAWLILPAAHVLAISIPVLWLVNLGRHGLPAVAPQRAWGILASGLTLGPLLMLGTELFVGLLLLILGSLAIVLQPEQAAALQDLAQKIQSAPSDPTSFFPLVESYLRQPMVIYLLLAYFSAIVPLVEEALKPIGVWLLAGRRLTSSEGFVSGLLCGAGMSLIESLSAGSAAGASWTTIVIARWGTAAMHIFTAGLMGWALASAWAEKRYFRLAFVYGIAVLIHGLWNGMTVAAALLTLQPSTAAEFSPLAALQIGLASAFGVLLIFGLLSFNATLRRRLSQLPVLSTISPSPVTISSNGVDDAGEAKISSEVLS